MSSAYNPKSNGRAEVAVKKVKRFLIACIGPSGSLDSDKFLRGMLQLRNSPDKDCHLSPAQIIFGRPLRDAFSFVNRELKFQNPAVRSVWRDAWRLKEEALMHRFIRSVERKNEGHNLSNLNLGSRVFVQNQHGPHPNKWDKSGVIVECKPFDQYLVKIDGSGRLTTRNRKFLRHFTMPMSQIDISAPNVTMAGRSLKTQIPLVRGSELVQENPQISSKNAHEIQQTGKQRYNTTPEDETQGQSAMADVPLGGLHDSPEHFVPSPLVTLQNSGDVVMPSSPGSSSLVDGSRFPSTEGERPHRSRNAPKRYVPESGTWE